MGGGWLVTLPGGAVLGVRVRGGGATEEHASYKKIARTARGCRVLRRAR